MSSGNIFVCLRRGTNEASEEEEEDEGSSAGAIYKIGMKFDRFFFNLCFLVKWWYFLQVIWVM